MYTNFFSDCIRLNSARNCPIKLKSKDRNECSDESEIEIDTISLMSHNSPPHDVAG